MILSCLLCNIHITKEQDKCLCCIEFTKGKLMFYVCWMMHCAGSRIWQLWSVMQWNCQYPNTLSAKMTFNAIVWYRSISWNVRQIITFIVYTQQKRWLNEKFVDNFNHVVNSRWRLLCQSLGDIWRLKWPGFSFLPKLKHITFDET